jgi:hypothetical protein
MSFPDPVAAPTSARDYPFPWLAQHIDEERREVSLLGEIREMVFGAQDGLVSTLAVGATGPRATTRNQAGLIAGLEAARGRGCRRRSRRHRPPPSGRE